MRVDLEKHSPTTDDCPGGEGEIPNRTLSLSEEPRPDFMAQGTSDIYHLCTANPASTISPRNRALDFVPLDLQTQEQREHIKAGGQLTVDMTVYGDAG